jgi:sec-independent protein translocase protein TatA
MGRIGFQELLLVFGLALLIFGPSKLPEIGKSLGRGIREFKSASKDIKESVSLEDDDELKKK